MAAGLKLEYDQEADILYVDTCRPYLGQESEELPDEIVVRLHPKTRRVENVEVLFFLKRLERGEVVELPVGARLSLGDAERIPRSRSAALARRTPGARRPRARKRSR